MPDLTPNPNLTPNPSPKAGGEIADLTPGGNLTPSPSPKAGGEEPNLTPGPSPKAGGGELENLIEGFSMRTKITGVVVTIQAKPTTSPVQLVAAIKSLDEGAEFDTEMRRDFGNRGDLKRAEMQYLTIMARGDKVTIEVIAVTGEGKQVTVEGWLEPSKAVELLGTLDLTDDHAKAADLALQGKEKGVLTFLGKGIEVSYRESDRDGKVQRRLAEFHSEVKKS